MENNVNYQEMYDRFDVIEKKHQEIKKMLSETNILVDSLKADSVRMLRDKQCVSDEEFKEAYILWCRSMFIDRKGIWGEYDLFDFINKYSLSEFVSKYKEYKDKQNEIKVGDEVYFTDPNYKSVVVNIEEDVDTIIMMSGVGKWHVNKPSVLHKTGKHYDIQSILNGLKESD